MKYLTTGQAAKLLMVTRDTVLKWIKQGKLSAVQTAGGHFRIPFDAVNSAITVEGTRQEAHETPPLDAPSYCWEYFASGGKTNSECRSCLVYKVRGAKCYEVGQFLKKTGFGATCCPKNCNDCPYYRDQMRQKIKVLIFTRDTALKAELIEQAEFSRLELQITGWEYDCAFIMGSFKPEYVVVDCLEEEEIDKYKTLCDHIMNDARVPDLQLLLAVPQERKNNHDFQEDITVIIRPFTAVEIETHLRRLGVHRAKEKWSSAIRQTG
jgi:excisionase family DNA binding protein